MSRTSRTSPPWSVVSHRGERARRAGPPGNVTSGAGASHRSSLPLISILYLTITTIDVIVERTWKPGGIATASAGDVTRRSRGEPTGVIGQELFERGLQR